MRGSPCFMNSPTIPPPHNHTHTHIHTCRKKDTRRKHLSFVENRKGRKNFEKETEKKQEFWLISNISEYQENV